MQDQEPVDLGLGEFRVLREVGVDLLHALADQLVHLGTGREVRVAGVWEVALLGPVAHRLHVVVDEDADPVASVTEGDRLLHIREELQLVLDVLGREQRGVRQPPHVLDPIDDLYVPVGVEIAGVAGMEPALGVFGLCSRLGILVVLLEEARRADEKFPLRRELELHARHRWADGVGFHLPVRLDAHEHGSLGRAVELLEVDADGAIEDEKVRPDGLSCRVGHPHAAHAQHVAQRPVDQHVADRIEQAVGRAYGLAVEDPRTDAARDVHEVGIHRALQRASILHADRDRGEQRLEHARRGEVIGGPDLAHVVDHGLAGLGAADAVARHEGLRIREDVLPYPGGRQVS